MWRVGRDLGERFIVRSLQGSRMRTEGGLFHEFAAALQFPYYFGGNWMPSMSVLPIWNGSPGRVMC